MEDAIGYFFVILLLLIFAPILFWLSSMLYMWIRWLKEDSNKETIAYSHLKDITNPVKDNLEIEYKLEAMSKVEMVILDSDFKELKVLFDGSKENGRYSFELNTSEFVNGNYFIQLVTNNQKLTKKMIIEN